MIDRPIRLLIIVPRYATIHRGVEVFAKELSSRLQDSFHVTILSGPHGMRSDRVDAEESPLLLRENLLNWERLLLRHLPARVQLDPVGLEALTLMLNSREFLRNMRFDIILPLGGIWTYRFAHRYRHDARIVGVGHAGPVMSELKLSDVFVALTPADEVTARRMQPRVPTCVIPNGVDVDQFYPVAASDCGKASRTILCVGALTAGKHHDLLFNAALRLDNSVRIVCVGQGPLISTLMQHPIYRQGRVEFVAKVHHEMPSFYRTADVFTLASPCETFGLVFLEALACGLPVVAHDAPRQRYVVGNTGFFCDVFDPDSYARALESALDAAEDPRRRQHAESLGWESVTGQYQVLFSDLCLSTAKLN